MGLLEQVKAEYHISEDTPDGRVDWAINDYITSHNLTVEEKNILILATSEEIRKA